MGFLVAREHMEGGDVAIVDCSRQCSIMLMNDANFSRYQSGKKFFCHGASQSNLHSSVAAPAEGYWNIVLDLGDGSVSARHTIQIVRNS